MKNRISLTVMLLLAGISFSCSGKDPVAKQEEPPVTPGQEVEKPKPVEDTEDWVYRVNPETGKKEKFFGIGYWGIPGYTLKTTADEDPANAEAYRKWTANCNLLILDPKCLQPYMKDMLLAICGFAWPVYNFSGQPGLPTTADKDYYRMQYLKANANSPAFAKALDDVLDEYLYRFRDNQRMYAPIDEIALGGLSKWAIPAAAGDKIYERIKLKEQDPIVQVDLLGHGRGSTFFFERNYLKTHPFMPANPPYDLLSENARKQTTIPLLGFFQAHDGTPVYSFDDKGNYSYSKIPIETLKGLWYENVKQVAAAYKNNGNVFSINAFMDFFANPVLAGVTTDAMKAGLGKMPVWLYFDGNAYARPSSVTIPTYIRTVKCQIYTSLVHGATGILFWNDLTKPTDAFVALQPMLQELKKDLPLIELPTVDRKIAGDLHLMVKQDAAGKKYLIATNTSKTNRVGLPIRITGKTELAQLEVLVSAL